MLFKLYPSVWQRSRHALLKRRLLFSIAMVGLFEVSLTHAITDFKKKKTAETWNNANQIKENNLKECTCTLCTIFRKYKHVKCIAFIHTCGHWDSKRTICTVLWKTYYQVDILFIIRSGKVCFSNIKIGSKLILHWHYNIQDMLWYKKCKKYILYLCQNMSLLYKKTVLN